jgi:RimJ/RimL family protein N-acetyltransferase
MELTTTRLQINALRPADAPVLFGYRADPEVTRFQGWRPASLAEVADFIAAQGPASADIPDGWFQRAIRLRQGGDLIGDIGIHMPADAAASIEFGISMAPDRQRQGYAGEVLQALFTWVFGTLGRHRIHASVDPRNLASMAMLRSLGMRQEAHFRESLWFHGEWVDDVVFAMLAQEWSSHRG